MYKEKMFKILDNIYNITSVGAAEIDKCLNCTGCPCEAAEAGEFVTLLPYEADYIAFRLISSGREHLSSLVSAISDNGLCPFLKDGICTIHDVRPIDCRSYPLIPHFKREKLLFFMSTVCPHRQDVKKQFAELFKQVWIMLTPLLDETWRKNYYIRNHAHIEKY